MKGSPPQFKRRNIDRLTRPEPLRAGTSSMSTNALLERSRAANSSSSTDLLGPRRAAALHRTSSVSQQQQLQPPLSGSKSSAQLSPISSTRSASAHLREAGLSSSSPPSGLSTIPPRSGSANLKKSTLLVKSEPMGVGMIGLGDVGLVAPASYTRYREEITELLSGLDKARATAADLGRQMAAAKEESESLAAREKRYQDMLGSKEEASKAEVEGAKLWKMIEDLKAENHGLMDALSCRAKVRMKLGNKVDQLKDGHPYGELEEGTDLTLHCIHLANSPFITFYPTFTKLEQKERVMLRKEKEVSALRSQCRKLLASICVMESKAIVQSAKLDAKPQPAVLADDTEEAPTIGDICGKEEQWEKTATAMAEAVQMQHSIVRDCIASSGGYEVKGDGEAFMAAFQAPAAAVLFCARLLGTFAETEWPKGLLGGALQLRVGVNTGRAEQIIACTKRTQRVDYIGPVVAKAARVSMIAPRCTALLAEATRAALENLEQITSAGASVASRGTFRLAGFPKPETLYEVVPKVYVERAPVPIAAGQTEADMKALFDSIPEPESVLEEQSLMEEAKQLAGEMEAVQGDIRGLVIRNAEVTADRAEIKKYICDYLVETTINKRRASEGVREAELATPLLSRALAIASGVGKRIAFWQARIEDEAVHHEAARQMLSDVDECVTHIDAVHEAQEVSAALARVAERKALVEASRKRIEELSATATALSQSLRKSAQQSIVPEAHACEEELAVLRELEAKTVAERVAARETREIADARAAIAEMQKLADSVETGALAAQATARDLKQIELDHNAANTLRGIAQKALEDEAPKYRPTGTELDGLRARVAAAVQSAGECDRAWLKLRDLVVNSLREQRKKEKEPAADRDKQPAADSVASEAAAALASSLRGKKNRLLMQLAGEKTEGSLRALLREELMAARGKTRLEARATTVVATTTTAYKRVTRSVTQNALLMSSNRQQFPSSEQLHAHSRQPLQVSATAAQEKAQEKAPEKAQSYPEASVWMQRQSDSFRHASGNPLEVMGKRFK
eukprot:m51a1_g4216 putative adenylate cyclase (1033) ;mRNA; r:80128-83513